MTRKPLSLLALALATGLLSACGGGGSSAPPPQVNQEPPPPPPPAQNSDPEWVAGVFEPRASFKDLCATPRTGEDIVGVPFPDQQGRELDEKLWLRSWTDETYLWFEDVADNDPNDFTVAAYFEQLRSFELTDTGSFRDNFHFSESTEEFTRRQTLGQVFGYGFDWRADSTAPPRSFRINYTEPNSPAALAGVSRGASLLEVDGVDFVNGGDVATINAGLFPDSVGEVHTFRFRDVDGSETTLELTSANIELFPVQNTQVIDTPAGRVGYLQFNTFISAGQQGLIDAFSQFAANNVAEVVVDLRYNGGGLLAMSSQLGYMIAGPAQTDGRTFELSQYNSKSTSVEPVNGSQIQPLPFYGLEIDWEALVFTDRQLPSVNLSRVYVLSTPGTCSASEALINGLRGIDVEVVLIGDTTCGKPYGFFPQDNCGTTYYTIQFQGVNDKGFGDFADGFVPTATPQFAADVPGCPVADDLNNPLGSQSEALLAAAIQYMQDGTCPAQPAEKSLFRDPTGPRVRAPDPVLEAIQLEQRLGRPVLGETSP